MLANMTIHNMNITTNPPNMECNPKNTIDHSMFSISCTANIPMPNRTSRRYQPCLHTKNNAIPIKI